MFQVLFCMLCAPFEVLGLQVHKLLVEGGPCRGGLALSFVRRLARTLLRALHFVHSSGLSHNDMYYHNLLLRSSSPDAVVGACAGLTGGGKDGSEISAGP